jgi:apolipoprotein N-acyltransferase
MALSEVPSPDLVVWPETAFVPSFYYHSRYRIDADSYALVKDALDYLGSKNTPFVIGNDEARIGIDGSPLEYNSALLFSENEFKARYYKRKLVPFSEYFPYGEQFPEIYKFLESKVAHFWDEGQNPVVFELNDYKFSTPICFEDTFGGISREFVQDGAELIVNLSNDSWSKSLSCQNQHLGMAVFRAVENRRSVVRSTTSGQTCAIDPNGFIMAEAPPFEERVLSVNVPVLKSLSIYTRAGDVLPLAAVFASLVALIARLFLAIIRRTKAGKKWQTIINHL